jgi:hypothetical protein
MTLSYLLDHFSDQLYYQLEETLRDRVQFFDQIGLREHVVQPLRHIGGIGAMLEEMMVR